MDSIEKCSIEIVHGCPLRCVGCPMSTLKTKIRYIEKEVFAKIIKNIDVKIKHLRLFSFGEPMLHPKLPELIRMVPKRKVKWLEISTSGQFYTKWRLKAALRTKRLNVLGVSCDGNRTAKKYQQMRAGARWDKLVRFMKDTRKYRDKVSPKTKLVARIIKTGRGRKWVKFCKQLGWSPRLRHFKRLPDASLFIGPKKRPTGLCKFIRDSRLYVDYDGTVVPCCRHPRAFVMGNILETPYSKLIRSEKYKQAVLKLKNNRKSIRICSQCDKT